MKTVQQFLANHKNAGKPAYPVHGGNGDDPRNHTLSGGLTKREIFCLHNSIPKTGDEELDAIIREGNKRKAAMAAMQGLNSAFSNTATFPPNLENIQYIVSMAVTQADELLKQLESHE